MVALSDYLPRGESLSDSEFKIRHTLLQWVLLAHLPALLLFGLARGYGADGSIEAIVAPAAFLVLSRMLRSHRLAALAITAGLSSCSAALVVLSGGSIEAHFHFFVTIGLIALYQDWVPFIWNALFTTVSHGFGSWLMPTAFFAHVSGQHAPWTWSVIHGVAVLAACAGVIVQMRFTEDDHRRTIRLRAELLEGNRKRFTADLLVNLARRNQNLIYRQLELLNRLEDHERDAEQLSHLFQLDHLATRIRRNAESLLVLSGEEPARKWGGSVLLVDVVRAAIAEIEELDRVDFSVDESLAVSGRAVADATHLLAELIENAVHFSPPGLSVMIRTRPYLPSPGAQVLTIEDWGVGMLPAALADANDLLIRPRDVDLATSQRLGLHVVSRLAARYGIVGSLESTPGGGVTAVVVLPAELFAEADARTPVAAGGLHAPALPAPGPTGSGLNGSDLDGSGAGGYGVNGHGSNGSGLNGPGLNGHGANGSALNGHGSNGPGANGPGANGSGLSGSGFSGSDGPGATAAGPTATAAGPTATAAGPTATGAGPTAPGATGTTGTTGAGLTGHGATAAGLYGHAGAADGLDGTATGARGRTGHGTDGAGPGTRGPAGDGLDATGGRGLSGFAGAGGTGPAVGGPGGLGIAGGAADSGALDGLGDLEGLDGLMGLAGPGLRERRVPGAAMGGTAAPEVPAERAGMDADGWARPVPAPRIDAAPPARGGDAWSNWWPLPAEETRPAERGVPAPSLSEGGLTRRTPQANLAEELRRSEQAEAAARPVRPRRDPTETRSALSRFQATQRAARQDARRPGTDGEARP